MQNRLLAIIYLLMNRGAMTASELAERFEVSTRTIYRDVETLSMAGIPVYAKKGKNGGIALTEEFVLDRMLVTDAEQQEILAALTSLRETRAQPDGETIRKLEDFFKKESKDWVTIDLSDWSGLRQELFSLLKQAIFQNQVIAFDYYGQYGEMSCREAEPIQLMFKDHAWYLRAFCRKRQAERVFKLMRMKRVCLTGETISLGRDRSRTDGREADSCPAGNKAADREGRLNIEDGSASHSPVTKLCFELAACEAYRVYDCFEEEEITRLEDGSFRIEISYVLDDWVYGLLLSFGTSVRLLGPEEVKAEFGRRLRKMVENLG